MFIKIRLSFFLLVMSGLIAACDEPEKIDLSSDNIDPLVRSIQAESIMLQEYADELVNGEPR